MNPSTSMEVTSAWPLLAYFIAVIIIAGGMVVVSHFLGERHKDRETTLPYESGVSSTGSARIRRSSHFYLMAMFFLIFDLEAVYIFSWAVAARQVGWTGYIEVLVFVGVLLAALLYLWRIGSLEWGPQARRRAPLPQEHYRKGSTL